MNRRKLKKITEDVNAGEKNDRNGIGQESTSIVQIAEDQCPEKEFFRNRSEYYSSNCNQYVVFLSHSLNTAVIDIIKLRGDTADQQANTNITQVVQDESVKNCRQCAQRLAERNCAGIDQKTVKNDRCTKEVDSKE